MTSVVLFPWASQPSKNFNISKLVYCMLLIQTFIKWICFVLQTILTHTPVRHFCSSHNINLASESRCLFWLNMSHLRQNKSQSAQGLQGKVNDMSISSKNVHLLATFKSPSEKYSYAHQFWENFAKLHVCINGQLSEYIFWQKYNF